MKMEEQENEQLQLFAADALNVNNNTKLHKQKMEMRCVIILSSPNMIIIIRRKRRKTREKSYYLENLTKSA